MFELDEANNLSQGAKIKVIGVGGGGGNAVNTMIRSGLTGVEFINANTDNQALQAALAPVKLQIGNEITKGLGAGANPDVGRRAALEDYNKIAQVLQGADMVFITAGMGGGTGTGAAPVIAKIAKELGALTVGVVTKPFDFEGKKRKRHAEEGIRFLKESVDSLITIPNQRLLALAGNHLTVVDTFLKADEVLLNAVQGISDLINHTGLINSDFADVRTIMADRGLALMGTGIGQGEHRAIEAATNAISSPLLEDVCIDGATGLIINITGGSDLTTYEVNEATTLIMEAADEDAEIIFGTVIDDSMKDRVKITVIATGIGDKDRHSNMQGTQAAGLVSLAQKNISQAVTVTPAVVATPAVAVTPAVVATPAIPVAPPVPVAADTPVAPAPTPIAVSNPVVEVVAEVVSQAVPPPTPAAVLAPALTPSPVESEIQKDDTIIQGFHPSPATVASIEAQVELFDQEVDKAVEVVEPVEPVEPTLLFEKKFAMATMEAEAENPVQKIRESIEARQLEAQKEIKDTQELKADQDAKIIKQAKETAEIFSGAKEEKNIHKEKIKLSDLERAKQVARNLGVTNLSDDEYDIPTFIRRQQQGTPPTH